MVFLKLFTNFSIFASGLLRDVVGIRTRKWEWAIGIATLLDDGEM